MKSMLDFFASSIGRGNGPQLEFPNPSAKIFSEIVAVKQLKYSVKSET